MEGENNEDHVWAPESSDAAQYSAITSSAPRTTSGEVLQSESNLQAYPDPLYVTGTYQSNQVQHYAIPPGGYRIAVSQQQLYQQPTPSYERISPVHIAENMPTYSTMQPADGSHMIATPTVDSSTLQASAYPVQHVVLNDGGHVQRVISPVDCTVSQSALGLHRQDSQHEAEPAQALLPSPSMNHHYHTVRVTRQPSFNGEVSTSAGVQGEGLDQETDQAVSSISSRMPQGQLMSSQSHKIETDDMDEMTGEPDTTQQDDSPDYHDTVRLSRRFGEISSLDDSSQVLHSTMMTSNLMSSSSREVMTSNLMSSSSREVMTSNLMSSSSREVMTSNLMSSSSREVMDPTMASSSQDVVMSRARERRWTPRVTTG
ncbi:hypothetical protein ScPMuIL_003372 [Solemya velum]